MENNQLSNPVTSGNEVSNNQVASNQQPNTAVPKTKGRKTVWVVIVTAIIAGGLAGSGTYYYVHAKATTDKNNLQNQIDTASKKVESLTAQLKAASSTTTSTSSTTATPSSTTPTSSTATTNIFSLTNLESATIDVSGTEYQLTNGVYTHPGNGPFDTDVPSTITLDQKNIAVDSANANQAAIVLAVGSMRHGGATTNFNELEIMTNSSGTPKYLARILLNDYSGSTVNSVSFASNVVTVNLTPADETSKTVTYQLANGTLTQK
jgi:cytoskeletal protein RodZ